mmetsp:Transcript_42127/g.78828  ORF Transcript_42127/g.78828 Transcript_42127/m.78828 type:complete len:345 (-) Transcript_42127:168-1202(-)
MFLHDSSSTCTVAILLACWVCAGYGLRRAHATKEQVRLSLHEDHHNSWKSHLQSHERGPELNSMDALATLFLTLNHVTGWKISGAMHGFSPSRSNLLGRPAARLSGLPGMQTREPATSYADQNHVDISVSSQVSRNEQHELAKQKLRRCVQQVAEAGDQQSDARREVVHAINELQSFYTPPATSLFLKLMLEGDWKLIFSTVKPSKQGPVTETGEPLVRISQKEQFIEFSDDHDEGRLLNTFHWDVPTAKGVRGNATVVCSFKVFDNGSFDVKAKQHLVSPEAGLGDVEAKKLTDGLRAAAPEHFLPQGQWITMYADPEIRMLAGMGERLMGVVLIFEKSAKAG